MSNANVVKIAAKSNLVYKFANRFGVDEDKVVQILRSTAFKVKDGSASDEQVTALMIVSEQYGLNPWTKEIYAYPDKNNGIVPVVGVDGWSRIINEHPQMDGIEFNYSKETVQHKGRVAYEWIECVIYRKDRSKPVVVREYFDEVLRLANFATPWDSHPKRMHRHKAEIQCARIAFGFAGIYDEDEAARIIEKDVTAEGSHETKPAEPVYIDDATFKTIADKYKESVASGKKSVVDFVAWVEGKGALLTKAQKEIVQSWVKTEPKVVEGEIVSDPFVADMESAESAE